MRTAEQTEQFKRDCLAQIDEKALSPVEKCLYDLAISKDLTQLAPWHLTRKLEELPIPSEGVEAMLREGYHLPHLLPTWLSELLVDVLRHSGKDSVTRGLYRFRLAFPSRIQNMC